MLKLKNIQKVFLQGTPNEMVLYEDLNLQIEQGEFISVIGSNGSGKSTFLNLVAGTLKPEKGQIEFDEKVITHQEEYLRSKKIARVYQDPLKGTAPSLSILENLSMAINKGQAFNLSKGINLKALDRFKTELASLNLNLEDKLHTLVGSLSGGQRQALSLLMATLVQPKLLLLDEHTAALDPKTSERILELTQSVVHEKNLTTIMVTHNLKHAIEYGNRLMMFHKGKVIFDIKGEEKKKLTVSTLIEKFNQSSISDELDDELVFN